MDNELSPEVVGLMEQFVRDMTKYRCTVFGMVFCSKPEPAMGMMRNSNDDPVRMLNVILDVVRSAKEDGRIKDVPVLPLQ